MRSSSSRPLAGHARQRAASLIGLVTSVLVMLLATGCGPSRTPDTVIIAASATRNEPEPVLSADIIQMLRSAATSSSRATAYVVAPGSGQPIVLPLTPRRPDGQVDFGPSRGSLLTANVKAVQRAVERQASRSPFDLLGAIAAATRVARPPATLVVVSSGLSTAGGLDMRQVGWDASPQRIAAELKARKLLPDLAGYRVVFSGLADTAGPQPALALPQRDMLEALWMAICRASGAVSCALDEMTRPDPPGHSAVPVPVVPVPHVHSVHGPHGRTITTLPSALLFRFGSSHLMPTADSLLRPIADHAIALHLRVSITGHASPDGGSASYNKALSERRAIAVRNRLIAFGLPPGQIASVAGVGTAGLRPGACMVAGHLDEAKCAQLRRVVIVQFPATNS